MSSIESEYRSRIEAMEGKERVSRTMGLLKWTREMLARQVLADLGTMSDERLKWEVAARLYGLNDPVHEAIERRLADVSS